MTQKAVEDVALSVTMKGMQLSLAVCRAGVIALTRTCECDDLISIGTGVATLRLDAWEGETLVVIANGCIHLRPGMRVNMCGEEGQDRIVGEFEELAPGNTSLRLIPISGRRVNLRVKPGTSLFVKYIQKNHTEQNHTEQA
jgi:hypothetical protein